MNGAGARRSPLPAVDVVIEVGDRIVLVRRRNRPHGWALPGGFVDHGEPLWAAAVREAREETGLDVELEALLHVYSAPDRDPRGHTISAVFVARASGEPVGGDDAAEARLFRPDELPDPIAFDHTRIVSDYLRFRRDGSRPPPDS